MASPFFFCGDCRRRPWRFCATSTSTMMSGPGAAAVRRAVRSADRARVAGAGASEEITLTAFGFDRVRRHHVAVNTGLVGGWPAGG